MKGDKFEPIMVAVAESELQRFRELKTENPLLKVQIESLKKENEQLKQQIEQLRKMNNEQKETLKKVRVALIQERTANIINYGKGGVEMFDNMFEILKGVSN